MNKINKNAIESIKVNDKVHLPIYKFTPPSPKTWFSKATPEMWHISCLDYETKEFIEHEGLCLIIGKKVYAKANVTITLCGGAKIIHRFDTNKEAHNYAHEYIKKNDIKHLINSI